MTSFSVTGQEQNFHKHPPDKIDTLGTPYDLGSIMHYHPQAFIRSGKTREKTIEPKVTTWLVSNFPSLNLSRMNGTDINIYIFGLPRNPESKSVSENASVK